MTSPWFYQDDSYHVPYLYNRMEYTPGLESFIDPNLQSFTTPSPHPTTMDQHHLMQLQLKEGQKTMFFNSDIPQQATFMPPTLGVMNIFHVRCISPFSAFETSEASGSAQSPPADTNTEPPAYYEARSPLQEPLHLEDFGFSQNHPIQFAGIGKGLGNGFSVNPMDVNSTGQLDGYDSETSTFEFTLPQRVDSWDSYTTGGVSGCDMEQIQQQQQHNSPIVDCTKPINHYPPASQEKIEEPSLVILPRATNLKRTRQADADAEEHLPTTKRTAAVFSRSTSTKTKTTAPRRGRPPTSHFPLTTHRPHQHQPTRTLPSTATKALTPNSSRGNLPCPHPPCHQSSHGFKDQPSLDAHIKKQHSRPFICVFSFAGCDSTFGSKNEWKRHVASQHLVLEYWLCQEGECANVDNNIPSSVAAISGGSGSRSGKRRKPVQTIIDENNDEEGDLPLLPNGAIFNRKDLYTQHVRRMHLPSHLTPFLRKESSPTSTSTSNDTTAAATTQQELNIYIATLQSRAQIKRCALPTYMRCPVPSCPQPPFKGTEAWDQRMEHVAKHLESYAAAVTATAATAAAVTAVTTTSGTRTGSEVEVDSSSVAEQQDKDNDKVEFGSESDTTLTEWAASREVGIIKRVIRTGSTGTGTGKAEGGGWRWVTRDPIKRRGHGGNGTGTGSGSAVSGGYGGGVGRGKGGRTKVVKTKGTAKVTTTEANMKREREVEEETIVVHTQTQNHQSFEFEEEDE
ncbi:hypothetical protein GE21DRAFT_7077 [Neurospora crassa]|uniref:C2H2-type domain-containing protein n=2 Tax=Neurospora crassa TaxID=5141 RepID=Q1K624_NEUCR|nr:hypothetical protein NCU04630 [Neurospora crassa OR74A]EAA28662.1 hypothetical protein NCU04630 [Neurospora crassa OR74A]KHE79425.1 hypothetical protein GE21DRAFT_7077 [Neurospora crassa]CAD37071.1 putative protein [Neurospora crassa]|eukprot:XP_957898.1 hypothetical protein NCU04630 [Neurospora crassa OR74A]